jgi:hypothetical protein
MRQRLLADPRELLRNAAHVTVLSTLAFAEPLIDILGRNPTFFAVRGSTSREIVLFALALTLAPPAALVLLEVAARAVAPRLGWALHLLFVGGLVAVLALEVAAKAGSPSGHAALAVAAAAGAAAAFAYHAARAARSFLTVLSPAPVVFLALFLVDSPVSKLVFARTPAVHAAAVRARIPVVLIVFDEFSAVSLMDRSQRIDAARYPSFAALARDSTWYRSAASTYSLTEVAVPSILTGLRPAPRKLPLYSEYPHNLFTLLGKSYRLRVVESLTHLCPRSLCRDTQPPGTQAVSAAVGSLASDVGVVYLHLLLPQPYESRLPAISDSWGDFGGHERAEPVRRSESGGVEACGRNVCAFTRLLGADRRPTLYFLHSLLPHTPYVYLPSGRRYAVDPRPLRGGGTTWSVRWAALESYQRYLFQVGYTDRALGLVLRRLHETGLYDRALVIVTADHGVSFRLGEPRRRPVPRNLDDVAFVPLFVKLPGQRRGRIVDSLAHTIDVLPTIARVLHVPLPWRVDGRPLVGRRAAAGGRVTMLRGDGSTVGLPLVALRAQRRRTLARQAAAFGTGSFASVYRIGPHRELLGRRVADLSPRAPSTSTVELDARTLLDAVDPTSGFVPSFVEGTLTGGSAPRDLAIAVDGRIAAVTETYRRYGETRFSAFVPEDALLPGPNAVDVFAVRGGRGRLVLQKLSAASPDFTLGRRSGREVIQVTGGRVIDVDPGAVRGAVHISARPTGFEFRGSAVRAHTGLPARLLIVFADGRAVYWWRESSLRPHRVLGENRLGKGGFVFELPRALLPAPGRAHSVRVFAVGIGVAAELRPAGAYPWATG